ncbi:acyl-CoA dehydrogenase/oxidase [Aspergillus karnatakaensis]|uniref:acyl-CoA dehydrogenase family protein n=1 Tax=Aspergillus karnatakaensis TaxID=1810916 RepID=UPI003CCD0332
MVSFTLSPTESTTRTAARSFASTHLASAKETYKSLPTPEQRFQALKPVYTAAVSAGLIKAQIPQQLGGTGGSLIESAILVEEFYAVEASASLTIFGTGLGLTPLVLAFREEVGEFLEPFLVTDVEEGKGEGGPIASLVFSEPGGVANWLEPGAPGLQTTAYRDGDEWVLNGEKIWATSSAGWDFGGADLSCVVARCVDEDVVKNASHPRDLILVLLVTRKDIDRNPGSFEVLKHIETVGHSAVSGPHVRYTNLRVPAKNLLCPPGEGAQVITRTFEMSAMLVGAMGVGIQRAIFDAALSFSQDTRGGTVPIAQRQAVGDLLVNIKMRTETSRYLTWKAAHSLAEGPGEHESRREHALLAKVHCGEAAVQSALDAINAVGVSAYNSELPFAELLSTALVLPIFDGGNVGMRRRALQELITKAGYRPWFSTFGEE